MEKEDCFYKEIYQLLSRCCTKHNPYDFCGQIVTELAAFIPYAQARILFLDVSGKICGSLLYGVTKRNWENFMDYYKQDLVESKYSLKEPITLSEKEKISVCCHKSGSSSLFMTDYVRSLRLSYSLGIGLCDENHCLRSIITLDRIKEQPFTEKETGFVKKAHPLLEAYFINLLLPAPADFSYPAFIRKQSCLTKRETEIVRLLTKGMVPAEIGKRLSISVSTVYKHIANVYKKCSISNRQQLYQMFQKEEEGI